MKRIWILALALFFTSTISAGELTCDFFADSQVESSCSGDLSQNIAPVDCNKSENHECSHFCVSCCHAPFVYQNITPHYLAVKPTVSHSFFLQHWKPSPYLDGLLQPPRPDLKS